MERVNGERESMRRAVKREAEAVRESEIEAGYYEGVLEEKSEAELKSMLNRIRKAFRELDESVGVDEKYQPQIEELRKAVFDEQ